MHGRRSLFLDLEKYNPKIERCLSRIRVKKRESKKKMVEEQAPPKQLKEYFTLATYDSHTSTSISNDMGQLDIKHSLIQLGSSFYGVDSKNHCKHVDACLDICSTIFLNNISSYALCLGLFPFFLKDKAKA